MSLKPPTPGRSHSNRTAQLLALLVFSLGLSLVTCDSLQPDPVRSVQEAVTEAVESLSQQFLNSTNATSEGRAALDQARAEADQPVIQQQPDSVQIETTNETSVNNSSIGPPTANCEGECEELADQLLNAVEGISCRSLFTTGKCPRPCMQAIQLITANSSWPPCAAMCGGDMVTGAAERWTSLCQIRQETLVDQGKEAVKSLVAEGITSKLHASVLMQFSIGVMILALGIIYGYRRGAISTHIAYRLRKRRLLERKNSDGNLPI
ncbi:hypothetical protein BWQ96_00435 [Gracilariopsis chorda]|uniref:Uncharacterized protein n=1 Tax=Gracilariopsis chorda TaxID=448386 RepID=A0A2V3J646_9FLOR|nr:hypothetical protein BWQ96_00435 [Gracilariopsis chorda]|eukprot:PXF49783.1 hypothetical protein BWQ96_00435 [Gracilariopsis chorda]